MLTFDRSISVFFLDGCPFGLGSPLNAIVSCLTIAKREDILNDSVTLLTAKSGDLTVSLRFDHGLLSSGYFWMSLPDGSASWGNCEAEERRRRTVHLQLLERLFGEGGLRTPDLIVEAMRDPKNGLEIISFSRTPRDGG